MSLMSHNCLQYSSIGLVDFMWNCDCNYNPVVKFLVIQTHDFLILCLYNGFQLDMLLRYLLCSSHL